ncbi:unnamed protein product, partial [Symbiodinium pilosum]
QRLEIRTHQVSQRLLKNTRFTARFVDIVSASFTAIWDESGCDDYGSPSQVAEAPSSLMNLLACMQQLTAASERHWLLMRKYAIVESSFLLPRWRYAWEADGGVDGEIGDEMYPTSRVYALRHMLETLSSRAAGNQSLVMVELGVNQAATTEALLKRRTNLQMILVDVIIRPEALKRTKAYARRVTWIGEPSATASSRVAPGSVDLVFIDAAHDYASVQEDILHWSPKVAPGGLLAGHDYIASAPGVVRAVNEF